MTKSENDLKAKLKALLAKTIENGASEAEAISAMKIAATLAEKSGLSLDDLKGAVEHGFAMWEFVLDGMPIGVGDGVMILAVSRYTGCEVIQTENNGMAMFGLEADVQHAEFLVTLLRYTVKKAYYTYATYVTSPSAGKRKNFHMAFAATIAERLKGYTVMKGKLSSGKELMVVKNQLVKDELGKRDQKPVPTTRTARATGSAAGAGGAAGSMAKLSNGDLASANLRLT